jgi:LemA protein
MTGLTITIIVIVAILLVILIWGITSYNGFIKLRNNADEAFSTMDVYLKQRFDLVPNLVETVKGYAHHESDVLQRVMEARSGISNAATGSQRMSAEDNMQGFLGRLFAVAENYPNLKANENFLSLQDQLKRLEDDIANSRRYYNGTVKIYNTKIQSVPTNIIAGMFHFEKKALYEVRNEAEREAVAVKF